MTDIYVSDLYGYEINSKTKFLVISGPHIYKFLRRIARNKNATIYECDMEALKNVLKNRNINISDYHPLGHIIYTKDKEPDKIILVHASISRLPQSFKEVGTFDGGKIMKPIHQNTQWDGIGALYVKNGSKPNRMGAVMIPSNLILTQDKKVAYLPGQVPPSNEFFLIQPPNDPIKTVTPLSPSLHPPRTMKLLDHTSKYLTLINNTNAAKLMSPLYSSKQLISYNAQGALVVNGKCLSQNDDSSVSFKSCDPSSIKQKWSILDGSISTLDALNKKCLTSHNHSSDVVLEQCKKMDEQTWDEEAEDTENSSDFSWDVFKGRNVVLVESDNPWFINKDDTYVQKYIEPDLPDASLLAYRANADVNFEQFEATNSQKDNSHMIFLLCIIIILLTLYRWGKR